MYVSVRLLKGYAQPLWYEIPQELQERISIGSLVKVPFRRTITSALVELVSEAKPDVSFTVKSIIACHAVPADEQYNALIERLSAYYQISPLFFMKRLRHFLQEKNVPALALGQDTNQLSYSPITLTPEQQACVDQILSHVHAHAFAPFVLQGVTGSGKTEVYKAVMHEIINNKRSVIYLLPEVTLAVQISIILRTTMQGIALYTFHSATSPAEKRALWNALQRGEPVVIVGVHLPILLPIKSLGLIIIDEEHETGFQEKKHPKINSKDIALIRASIARIPIILGSATPSITSLYNVAHKGGACSPYTSGLPVHFHTYSLCCCRKAKSSANNFGLREHCKKRSNKLLHVKSK